MMFGWTVPLSWRSPLQCSINHPVSVCALAAEAMKLVELWMADSLLHNAYALQYLAVDAGCYLWQIVFLSLAWFGFLTLFYIGLGFVQGS